MFHGIARERIRCTPTLSTAEPIYLRVDNLRQSSAQEPSDRTEQGARYRPVLDRVKLILRPNHRLAANHASGRR